MRSIKLSTVGESVGLVLPETFLKKMGVEVGDYLEVKETPNGIELSPTSADFSEAMEIAEKVMSDNRDLLQKLSD